MSVVMRVPTKLAENAKRIASMRGTSPSEVLAEAWDEYVENHRNDIAADFEAAARMFREGDEDGLRELAGRSSHDRAEAAAARSRG